MPYTNTADIEIEEDIKKSTTKCEKNFSCLSDKNHKLCNAINTISNKIECVDCFGGKHCNYREPYGFSSYLCTCPIRKEIYRKYKI